MTSPFSVSERETRCATSLTFSATRSPTEVMSLRQVEMHAGDRVAHLLALVHQISRCVASWPIRSRTRTSLSL